MCAYKQIQKHFHVYFIKTIVFYHVLKIKNGYHNQITIIHNDLAKFSKISQKLICLINIQSMNFTT